MKKIKKFLSVLLSSLALAGGKFTGNNKAFAGGENKIVSVRSNDSKECYYHLYVESEKIPRLVELFKARLPKGWKRAKSALDEKIDKTLGRGKYAVKQKPEELEKEPDNSEDKEKFYQTGVYKAIVGVSGLALAAASYAGASRIKNKNTSNTVAASICSAIGLGTLAAMFLPDFLSSNSNDSDQKKPEKKFKQIVDNNKSNEDNKWITSVRIKNDIYFQGGNYDIYNFKGGRYCAYKYDDDYDGLISSLETVSPDLNHRKRHNKLVHPFYPDEPIGRLEERYLKFSPCFSDNDEGIILCIKIDSHDDNYGGIWRSAEIERQGKEKLDYDMTKEGYLVLSPNSGLNYHLDKVKIDTKKISSSNEFDNIVNKLIDKMVKGEINEF